MWEFSGLDELRSRFESLGFHYKLMNYKDNF
jgi:hypothetical protein